MKVTRREFRESEEVGSAGYYVDSPAKDTAEVEHEGATYLIQKEACGRLLVLGPDGFVDSSDLVVRLYSAVDDWRL